MECPKYLQVANHLRREIADGIFPEGETLLTEEELRQRFHVSRQTIRQAISLLEDDGLVERRRGSGTYIHHGPRRHLGPLSIGVVTTYITDYIFPSIVGGIESVLSAEDCVLCLSATYNNPQLERRILERMMSGGIDGLIVEAVRSAEGILNSECYRRLTELNIPVLFLNSYYPSLPQLPHLVMDDYNGGREAARELLARGYAHPSGFFKTDDLQGQERARGFMDELKEQGVDLPESNLLLFTTADQHDLFHTKAGQRFISRLTEEKATDSVVGYNDLFMSDLLAVLQKKGCIIPDDLGIISFDDSIHASLSKPGLTTYAHPKESFGKKAAEMLLQMINGEKAESVSMPWTLVERESLRGRSI